MVKISYNRETYLALLLITALVLGAFWEITLMRGYIITDDIFTSDIMNEGFPYRYSLSQALKSGEAPLWVSEIYGGFPLLARAEAGICYPVNIILFWLLSPYAALNIVLLLTMITAGVSAFLYLREIKVTAAAALTGAVAFTFCGYLLSHLKHLSNVNSACWLPLGLFFLERAAARKEKRPLVWFGLVFGLQQLAGHTQVAYYSGVVYIFYFIFRSLHEYVQPPAGTRPVKSLQRRGWRILISDRRILLFFGMLILGSLLGAVQLIPTYELVSLSQRSGGVTFDYASNYAYDPKNLLTFLYPYINGDIGNATYTGSSIFWEDYGYVGIAILAMALYAVFRRWKNWHVRFFAAAALISIIFVLGPSTPVYKWAFDFVPGMKYFRFPTRFLLITDISLVILAAIGISSFSEILERKKKRSGVRFGYIVLAVTVVDLLYFQLRQNPVVEAEKWLEPPRSVRYIRQDTSLFRIFNVGGNQAHIQTFQRARGWEGDLQPYIDQREYIQPSSNVLYGLQSPNGYANLTPNYVVDIWGDQNRTGILNQTAALQGGMFLPTGMFWRLMDMYNVKYITSFWQIKTIKGVDSLARFLEAYTYRNNNFMPRAYLVSKLKKVSTQNEALKILFSNDFNPRSEAIVFQDAAELSFSEGASGDVGIQEYSRNEVVMTVRSDRAGFLVFSDTYYPGWKADVDGNEARIHRVNVTQRGVAVPEGVHTVRFRFSPATVTTGILTSAGGSLLFLGILFMTRRRREGI